MSDEIKLSDHCIIDHFEKVEGIKDKFTPKMILGLPMMLFDRKMHFTGFRGGIWRVLGIDRSQKNPNICNV